MLPWNGANGRKFAETMLICPRPPSRTTGRLAADRGPAPPEPLTIPLSDTVSRAFDSAHSAGYQRPWSTPGSTGGAVDDETTVRH